MKYKSEYHVSRSSASQHRAQPGRAGTQFLLNEGMRAHTVFQLLQNQDQGKAGLLKVCPETAGNSMGVVTGKISALTWDIYSKLVS